MEKCSDDFVVPDSGQETLDGLTFRLTALLVNPKRFLRRKKQLTDEIHAVSDHAKVKLDTKIVTTISSIFPILPTIILFFINQLLITLGLVLLFTVLFAFVPVFGPSIESDKTLAVTTALYNYSVEAFVQTRNMAASQLSRSSSSAAPIPDSTDRVNRGSKVMHGNKQCQDLLEEKTHRSLGTSMTNRPTTFHVAYLDILGTEPPN